jgi:hypothetical protein
MPEKVSIPVGNVVTTYYGKDSLLNKLIDPIPLGSARNGPVIFSFADATPNIVSRPSTYVLHFKDISGKDYQSSTETFTNPQPPAFGLPGIQQDVNVITPPATTQGAPKELIFRYPPILYHPIPAPLGIARKKAADIGIGTPRVTNQQHSVGSVKTATMAC